MEIGNSDFFTIKELQDYLRIGRNKTYKLVNQNDFPKIQVGKSFIIPKEDLQKYLQRKLYKKIDL